MKKTKRFLSLLLAAMLAVSMLTVSASAATTTEETKAQVLSALGLFKGYDDTGTNFGLANGATREHAIVFLIRMLGEESAAQSWTGTQAFSDVPSSSYYYSYIGYAKAKGYTNGLSGGKFGLGQSASMKQMAAFALRGLGYSEMAGDFTYQDSLAFAKSKGILDSAAAPATFTRGSAVDVIFGATFSNVKGQSYTLVEKLAANGAVTETQLDKANDILDGKTTTTTAQSNISAGTYTLKCMGNGIRVTSGKMELRNTSPAQIFTITNKNGYSYIQTADGYYLGVTSLKNATQVVAGTTPYSWLIQKVSSGVYTIRPAEKPELLVCTSEASSSNGAKLLLWPHTDNAKHGLVTFTASASATNPTSVSLNKTTISLAVGKTYDLDATVSPSGATKSITYTTSNSAIAKVSSTGVVTGVKAGTATITVTTHNGKTATCKVTVTAAATATYTDKKVNLYNSTAQNVTDIRISSTQNADWGSNLTSSAGKPNASVTILVPVSSTDYTYDILITYADGSTATFAGYSFKSFTSGSALYAYISNGTPILSTTKPSAGTTPVTPDTSAASKALTTRYNTAVTRYNALVDEVNKIDALTNDSSFVSSMNSITASIESMGKVIGEGTGVYTEAQIAQYNSALDSLDSLMNDLDKAVAAAKAEASKPADDTRNVTVTFINLSGKSITDFRSSSAQLSDWGDNLLFGTAADQSSFKVIFPVSTSDYVFDFKVTVDGTQYDIFGIDFSAVTGSITCSFAFDGSSLTLYQS